MVIADKVNQHFGMLIFKIWVNLKMSNMHVLQLGAIESVNPLHSCRAY